LWSPNMATGILSSKNRRRRCAEPQMGLRSWSGAKGRRSCPARCRQSASMMAPMHHPAIAHVCPHVRSWGPVRYFNILGPADQPRWRKATSFTGAYRRRSDRRMAETLGALGERVCMGLTDGRADDHREPSWVAALNPRRHHLCEFEINARETPDCPYISFEDIMAAHPEETHVDFNALLGRLPPSALNVTRFV